MKRIVVLAVMLLAVSVAVFAGGSSQKGAAAGESLKVGIWDTNQEPGDYGGLEGLYCRNRH
jgi:hypothetical protein